MLNPNIDAHVDDDRIGRHRIHCVAETPGDNDALISDILAEGTHVDARDCFGTTSACLAADANNIKCLRVLLQAGAQPDGFETDSPLYYACRADARQCAFLLIEYGATPAGSNVTDVPLWLQEYIANRARCRHGAIALLSLRRNHFTLLNTQVRDVIRLIALSVWSHRHI